MAYNDKLADRVRELFSTVETNVEEKKMFGGLCFMINDKMCIGVEQERLMLRIDPELVETVLEYDGCRPMDFTGRIMRGYVFVDAAVLGTKRNLHYWVNIALAYNKIAKSSKKRKK